PPLHLLLDPDGGSDWSDRGVGLLGGRRAARRYESVALTAWQYWEGRLQRAAAVHVGRYRVVLNRQFARLDAIVDARQSSRPFHRLGDRACPPGVVRLR